MPTITRKLLPAALIAVAALTACGKKEAEQAAPQQAAGPEAGASPQAAPANATKSVEQLLADARRADAENRTLAPPGNNAMEYYLAVLAQEPQNDRAVSALIDLFPLGATQAESEIADRNMDEAQRIVDLLDRANPDSYSVSRLKSKLNAARTQIQREEERRLAQEAEATRRAQAAAEPAPAPATTQPVASATRPASTPEPSTTTPPPAAQPTPEPEPAKPVLPSRDAVLVRTVRPSYPPKAARARQEGWVEVQFTVGADGKVADVKVVRGDPARVFDREAIRAVQQWEFQPAIRDGQPAAMNMTRRIEFKLGG
ncbi:energy transducer TonB [Ahniella affigens]|uniref:Energy transducer TonB n=1 Tax=Ahniella affigens TaxID=2021234 RepID=A0A2P1PUX7_9GAMM|nr:energy transducer TonB [Ahniella affigens]AVP98639.1 energy transducer TonB [Ahniella affigens]